MDIEKPYNPLDKVNLGVSVADAMLIKPAVPLPPPMFRGAGIYAIYYTGSFPLYKKISALNQKSKFDHPIYIGKAVPPGARKGGVLGEYKGTALSGRMKEHADTIQQVKNLNLNDFFCRYLVVEDIWIPLGETLLIEKFQPIWNSKLSGYGNHDPGGGRHGQKKSPWDTIHPGRPWADKLKGVELSADIIEEGTTRFIEDYVRSISPSLDQSHPPRLSHS
ncbi:MAG: Eco29kI family restriction endonuclease [Fibrobacterota bacterium]|nr:Eco29kI family restriction endonuclease [Fibrobacterota bacterium]